MTAYVWTPQCKIGTTDSKSAKITLCSRGSLDRSQRHHILWQRIYQLRSPAGEAAVRKPSKRGLAGGRGAPSVSQPPLLRKHSCPNPPAVQPDYVPHVHEAHATDLYRAKCTNPGSKKGVPNQRCKRSNVQDVELKRFRQPLCTSRRLAVWRARAAGCSQIHRSKRTGPVCELRLLVQVLHAEHAEAAVAQGPVERGGQAQPQHHARVLCNEGIRQQGLQAVRRGTKQQRVAKPTRPSWLAGLNNSQHVSSCSGEN